MTIKPAFANENIPVVFSSDNGYALYLGVCIRSLIANSSSNHNYDIVILDGGISDTVKQDILDMQKQNVSIRFINIDPYLKDYDLSIFSLRIHFTLATYYRFFLPIIFQEYSKVLYIDCDTVILNDVAELYQIDIKDNYIGATRDIEIIRTGEHHPPSTDYYYKVLKMKDHKNYFQAGCMICNITKMLEINFTQKLIERLKEIKTPRFVDQCVLNSLCEGKVKFIPQNWNYTWHIAIMNKVYEPDIPEPYLRQFKSAQTNPYIIHFTAVGVKPWLNPALEKAHYFWFYARQTPFYEEILYRNLKVKAEPPRIDLSPVRAALQLTADKIKYWRYKLLSRITFGKKRKKYKNKRKELKKRIKMAKDFLKGK